MTAAINTMGDRIQESGFENVVEHIDVPENINKMENLSLSLY